VTNRDWTAPELRLVALLDRCVERVHVEMDDLARRHGPTISGHEQKENHGAFDQARANLSY
jgi:hypothetical protein